MNVDTSERGLTLKKYSPKSYKKEGEHEINWELNLNVRNKTYTTLHLKHLWRDLAVGQLRLTSLNLGIHESSVT